MKMVYGAGAEGLVLGPTLISGTTVISATGITCQDFDNVSLGLIVDYQADQVVVVPGTDAVVASTKVFTFTNYTFTGLVGAKIQITGATNAGNNGTFVISAVSGHTATTSTAIGLVNETFGSGVTVKVLRSETASLPAGTWDVLAANDYSPGVAATANATYYGQAPNAGHFKTIKAMFSQPATIAAVSDAGSQIVQAALPLAFRHLQITFTPTGGLGLVQAWIYEKSYGN